MRDLSIEESEVTELQLDLFTQRKLKRNNLRIRKRLEMNPGFIPCCQEYSRKQR